MSEASSDNRVDPTSIQSIIQDESISRGDRYDGDHHEINAAENAASRDISTNLHTKDQ